jgi:hypothetical protein
MIRSRRRGAAGFAAAPPALFDVSLRLTKSTDDSRRRRDRHRGLIILAGLASAALVIAAPANASPTYTPTAEDRRWAPVWAKWEHELHRQCPSHHVNWIDGGLYDDLVGGFDNRLPTATRRKIQRITTPYDRQCEDAEGYTCEMATYLNAVERVGLLRRFTAFSCKAYRCKDITNCTPNARLLPKPQ